MTREEEENYYLEKIKALKEVYDELDSLVKMGYDGPFIGEEISPLMKAYFKAKWGKDYADVPGNLQADKGRQDAGVDGGSAEQLVQDGQRTD